jgi:hypothetical protein
MGLVSTKSFPTPPARPHRALTGTKTIFKERILPFLNLTYLTTPVIYCMYFVLGFKSNQSIYVYVQIPRFYFVDVGVMKASLFSTLNQKNKTLFFLVKNSIAPMWTFKETNTIDSLVSE